MNSNNDREQNQQPPSPYDPYRREKQYQLLFTSTRRPCDVPVFGCDNNAINYGRSFRGNWNEVNAEKERRCEAARTNREYPHWIFVELPVNKIVKPAPIPKPEELGLVKYQRRKQVKSA